MNKTPFTLWVIFLLLAGCSSTPKDIDPEPAPLPKIDNEQVVVVKHWHRKIGGGNDGLVLRLTPAVNSSAVFAVSANGQVQALDKESGKLIWKQKLKTPVSAGVAASDSVLVLSTTAGKLLAMDVSSGDILWTASLSSESLAPALLHNDQVIVQTIDGKLHSFDRADGHLRWMYETEIPVLTLRGTARPQWLNQWVLTGFSNGKLVAVDGKTGVEVWQRNIAFATGSSELERLVDVDGEPAVSGELLFAGSYQGELQALNLANGQQLWSHDISTNKAVATGFANVYAVNSDSVLVALDQNTGEEAWHQNKLLYRGLGAPFTDGNYILVGDEKGYLSVFSQIDGAPVGRKQLDGSAINQPVTQDGGRFYLQSSDGSLVSFSLEAMK